jgi:hypothetical protein
VKRLILLIALSLAVLAGIALPAAVAPASLEHRCKPGLRHALIAGRHRCLRAGQRCARKHDRQYHRYGFHCHRGRLTRRGGARPAPPAAPPSAAGLSFPIRATFYYPWFPETWAVRGHHVKYRPKLGYYNSSNADVVRAHIRQLQYGRFDVAIASWWGPGTHAENTRVPLLLDATSELRSPLRWALYYELEGRGNPSVAALQADLAYVAARYVRHASYARIGGKPVIFVYNANDSTCEVAERWERAAAAGWYVVLKVIPGYAGCAAQPDSWHQYGPAREASVHLPHSYNISPGFWLASEPEPRLRRDLARWQQNVRDMVASRARWQLVTSFNEWGEGTAIEDAREWETPSGYGAYLDALHANNGSRAGALARAEAEAYSRAR